MKKLFALLAVLTLSACGPYVHPGDAEIAAQECAAHQGFDYFETGSFYRSSHSNERYTLSITCRDGTYIEHDRVSR